LKTTVPRQHLNPGNTHVELINQIGHVKSLLNNLTQKTKELKARLNELSERKKGAGKSLNPLEKFRLLPTGSTHQSQKFKDGV